MEIKLLDGVSDTGGGQQRIARSEITLRFLLLNVSERGESVASPTFYVQRIPWHVRVYQRANEMQLALCCDFTRDMPWSCEAGFEFSLLKIDANRAPYTRKILPKQFTPSTPSWAIDFPTWTEITREESGYIHQDTLMIALHMIAEPLADEITLEYIAPSTKSDSVTANLSDSSSISLQGCYERVEAQSRTIAQLQRTLETCAEFKEQLHGIAQRWLHSHRHAARSLDGTFVAELRSELGLPSDVEIGLHIGTKHTPNLSLNISVNSVNIDDAKEMKERKREQMNRERIEREEAERLKEQVEACERWLRNSFDLEPDPNCVCAKSDCACAASKQRQHPPTISSSKLVPPSPSSVRSSRPTTPTSSPPSPTSPYAQQVYRLAEIQLQPPLQQQQQHLIPKDRAAELQLTYDNLVDLLAHFEHDSRCSCAARHVELVHEGLTLQGEAKRSKLEQLRTLITDCSCFERKLIQLESRRAVNKARKLAKQYNDANQQRNENNTNEVSYNLWDRHSSLEEDFIMQQPLATASVTNVPSHHHQYDVHCQCLNCEKHRLQMGSCDAKNSETFVPKTVASQTDTTVKPNTILKAKNTNVEYAGRIKKCCTCYTHRTHKITKQQANEPLAPKPSNFKIAKMSPLQSTSILEKSSSKEVHVLAMGNNVKQLQFIPNEGVAGTSASTSHNVVPRPLSKEKPKLKPSKHAKPHLQTHRTSTNTIMSQRSVVQEYTNMLKSLRMMRAAQMENGRLQTQIVKLQEEMLGQKDVIKKLKSQMRLAVVESEREVKERARVEMQMIMQQLSKMFVQWMRQFNHLASELDVCQKEIKRD